MRNKKNQKNTQTTIPNEVIRQQSGMLPDMLRVVEFLKRTNYYVIVRPIMGDAPKNFIKVYEYGKEHCKREPSKSWIPYIAKVGHKWYPNESIFNIVLNACKSLFINKNNRHDTTNYQKVQKSFRHR